MAGAAGIEPANHGIKTRCLTTWLRPSNVGGIVLAGRIQVNASWHQIYQQPL
jgi:hypothetical protein